MKNKDPEKDPVSTELPEWRNLDNSFKAVMYQLALADTEKNSSQKKLVPFVFCLSQKLTDEAATYKNEAAYISSRLTDSLRHKLKEVPPYWLSLEFAARNVQGFPHVQGSILLTDNQIPEFKKAIRSLNGKATPKFKNYETRIRENRRQDLINRRGQLHTDMNWALYNTKETGRAWFFTKCKRNIAVRQDLTHLAKRLYQELKGLHQQTELQQVTLEVLADTLAGSTILETKDTSGMISHKIDHPTLGKCLTVQADSNYLLITRL